MFAGSSSGNELAMRLGVAGPGADLDVNVQVVRRRGERPVVALLHAGGGDDRGALPGRAGRAS